MSFRTEGLTRLFSLFSILKFKYQFEGTVISATYNHVYLRYIDFSTDVTVTQIYSQLQHNQ